MKIIKYTALASLVLLSNIANADKLAGGYGACLSEELFDQWTTANVRNDNLAIEYLLENGCVVTVPDIKVSLIDMGWTGVVKLRAYGEDGSSVELWTYRENLVRGE